MKSYKLFAFYFSLSFVLLFSWMGLSRGESVGKEAYFEEAQPEIAVVRIPNVPKARKTEMLPADVQPDPIGAPSEPAVVVTAEISPEVSETSEASAPETETPISEIPEAPTGVTQAADSEISPSESDDALASAPEKISMNVLATNIPSSSLIKDYKTILASGKLESMVTPITLELVDDRVEPRGKMTSELVSLVVPLASPSESVKVFSHELGHVVDIKFLKPGIVFGDPSEKFYDISWVDMATKKPGMALKDFVSGYAMTNKYEDFGESFTYYLFHNNDFAKRAKQSKILQAKYRFFQKYVFPNQEFVGTGFELDPIPKYSWDTTKIPVALNKYLFYIK